MIPSAAPTPALRAVLDTHIWHQVYQYDHDDALKGFGAEAADKLGVDPKRIFKTLVVTTTDSQFVNVVLAVSDMLNLKRVATVLQVKSVKMAEPSQVQTKTGYVLGGISPLGQKTVLPMFVDTSIRDHETLIISGGQRGLSLELGVDDFLDLSHATVAHVRR